MKLFAKNVTDPSNFSTFCNVCIDGSHKLCVYYGPNTCLTIWYTSSLAIDKVSNVKDVPVESWVASYKIENLSKEVWFHQHQLNLLQILPQLQHILPMLKWIWKCPLSPPLPPPAPPNPRLPSCSKCNYTLRIGFDREGYVGEHCSS